MSEAEPLAGKPQGRRRRRRPERRTEAKTVKFGVDEWEMVALAAAKAGLSPAGWIADQAVAVARQEIRPAPAGHAAALGELIEARVQLRRFGTLVNQAVAALHTTGRPPESLEPAIALASRAVRRVDEATVALMAAR